MQRHAVIRCAWYDEAGVWFVRESDIPGLVTAEPSLEALRQKLPGTIQDLLDVDAATDIEVDLIACAHDRVRVEAARSVLWRWSVTRRTFSGPVDHSRAQARHRRAIRPTPETCQQ